uniref:Uncharacterized protein n=1 Tax=Anguilla anguilla TaxID=7936 RepID=A0A0E9XBZ3_ANGAN
MWDTAVSTAVRRVEHRCHYTGSDIKRAALLPDCLWNTADTLHTRAGHVNRLRLPGTG